VKVWSLADGALVAEPFVDAQGTRTLEAAAGVVWLADGESLYAGGQDGRIHEWDLAGASEVDASILGHDDRIIDALASSDNRVLVTLGRDQDVRVWDTSGRPPVVAAVADAGAPLYGLAATADGSLVAVGDETGTVHVFGQAQEPPVRLPGHSGRVFGLAFLPDGRLATGDDTGAVRIWDVESGEAVATSAETDSAITSVAADTDGTMLATSSADGVVRVYATDDLGEPNAVTGAVPARANQVVFTASGEIVAAYSDGQVRFWDSDGGRAAEPLEVDSDGDVVFGVAVTPDGQTLAAATATNGVTLWDLETREPHRELNGQPTDPIAVVFSPDGAALVSANRIGTLTLWNTATGQSIGPRFQYHSDAVWQTAVAGDVVISASEDGTVRRLDVLDVGRACDLGAGALDPRARAHYLGEREPLGCRS
jgi:WD40 repeat protein